MEEKDIIGITYISESLVKFDENDLMKLAKESAVSNHLNEISGFLFYEKKYFLQYIEGNKLKLKKLLRNINSDQRHKVLSHIVSEPFHKRRAKSWHMKLINSAVCFEKVLLDYFKTINKDSTTIDEDQKKNIWLLVDQIIDYHYFSGENAKSIIKNKALFNLTNQLENVAVWDWLPQEDKLVDSNERFDEIYELEQNNPLKEFKKRLFSEDREKTIDIIERGLSSEDAYEFKARFWNKNQSDIKWVKNKSKVLERDSSGQATRVIGVSKDITEEKLDEIKINLVTKQLNKAQSLAKIGSWYLNISNNEVSWTEEVYRMFGFDSNEKAPPLTSHEKLFTPKSWKLLSGRISETIEKGTPFDIELEMAKGQNSFGWMRSIGEAVFNENGDIIGLRGVAQDITEQKEINQKLQEERQFANAVTESSAAGIYIFNIKTNKNLYSNKKSEDILGYSPEELKEMPSETFMSRFHENDLASVINHFQEIITHKVSRQIKYRFIRKDHKIVTCLSVDSPFKFDENGEVESIMGSFIDITELQQKEEELIEARNEAINANKQKNIFMSNMSHEIRTPMNGIVGFSKLLKKPNLTSQQKDSYINQIERDSEQLMTIINDILDLSKLEAGKLSINKRAFDVNDLIEKLIENHRENLHQNQNNEIRLLYKPYHLRLVTCSDPVRLSQVINNLITNAIKFTPEGVIEVGFTKNKSEEISIWVKDEGIGIKEEQQALIFERFSQIEEKLSMQMGGIGLGLSISKSILDALGGKISLESSYGKGTTFTVNIPYEACESCEEIATSPKEETKKIEIKEAKKILIADDSPSIHFYYENVLRNRGIEILTAFDGDEAVEIAKTEKNLDLILLDLRMPKMDGLSALKKIREFNDDIKIIAQSAFAMNDQIESYLASGFNDYLTKPIEEDTLLKLIFEK